MMSDLGVGYGEHRRADAQTSCDSAGSSDTGHHRTEPLFITGNKARDAALGKPRIRAGEIIGWRFWKLRNGLLSSVFVPYTWRPGVLERSSSKHCAFKNAGYHAFRDEEQAERELSIYPCIWPAIIGSVTMWGEVIEHKHGWRSEHAAVRSITKIIGDLFQQARIVAGTARKVWLRRCQNYEQLTRMDESSRRVQWLATRKLRWNISGYIAALKNFHCVETAAGPSA
jgi:hypothetical protein